VTEGVVISAKTASARMGLPVSPLAPSGASGLKGGSPKGFGFYPEGCSKSLADAAPEEYGHPHTPLCHAHENGHPRLSACSADAVIPPARNKRRSVDPACAGVTEGVVISAKTASARMGLPVSPLAPSGAVDAGDKRRPAPLRRARAGQRALGARNGRERKDSARNGRERKEPTGLPVEQPLQQFDLVGEARIFPNQSLDLAHGVKHGGVIPAAETPADFR